MHFLRDSLLTLRIGLVSLDLFVFTPLLSLWITSSTAAVAIHVSEESSAVLWRRALKAQVQQDKRTRDQAILGWLSLSPDVSVLPAPFEQLSDELVTRAQETGALRIFASRMQDRIRIAIHDPAKVVGRIQCFIKKPSGWRLLSRLESHAVSRFEYGDVGTLSASDEFRVEAYLPWPDDGILVRRFRILQESKVQLPALPLEKAVTSTNTASRRWADGDSPSDLWWALAIGVIALGFTGTAVWQEIDWR